jgi:hypothetical protein
MERYPPRLNARQPKPSPRMPRKLLQRYELLVLIADVDEANTNLNISLRDLDKLDADPFTFGDTNPFARFKFLLRSVHTEFDRLSGFFDQYLRLCGRDVRPSERRKLQVIFGTRIRSLLAAAETEELATARGYANPNQRVNLIRRVAYIQALGAAPEPEHTTLADWGKVMRPRVQAMRRLIFAAGMEIATAWSRAIELSTSSAGGAKRSSRRPAARRLSKAYRNPT